MFSCPRHVQGACFPALGTSRGHTLPELPLLNNFPSTASGRLVRMYYCTLHFSSTLPCFFFRVVELVTVNKMGGPNVAMIFGPTLMSNENVNTYSFTSACQCIKCISSLKHDFVQSQRVDLNVLLLSSDLLFGIDNRPLPRCCEPQYENEVKCQAFHMKMSFVCI